MGATALISVSLALRETTAYAARQQIWSKCIEWFIPQFSLIHIAPIHGGVTRMS